MRSSLAAGLVVMFSGFSGLAGVAIAAPSAEIVDAAARVTVIPEARPDVAVFLVKANTRLPIWISRNGDKFVVRGNVGHQVTSCSSWGGHPSVGIWLRGRFAYQDLPQIVIRIPLDAHISAGDAVFGSVGHARNVELSNHGCGDWTVADVDQKLKVGLAGSGDLRAASAGSAAIDIVGSGDVSTGAIRQGLGASVTGSGDLTVASLTGPMAVHVSGSGDVKVANGRVSAMTVSIAGSGDVHFGGVAESLEASVGGSGDVTVAHVTGPVVKHVAGSGDVTVGH